MICGSPPSIGNTARCRAVVVAVSASTTAMSLPSGETAEGKERRASNWTAAPVLAEIDYADGSGS